MKNLLKFSAGSISSGSQISVGKSLPRPGRNVPSSLTSVVLVTRAILRRGFRVYGKITSEETGLNGTRNASLAKK